MGHQIIAQPDGKFAIWSSVCDDFVMQNATPEEIIEAYVEDERQKITESVGRIVKKIKDGDKPYYQFTKTWADCHALIRQRNSR